VEAVARDPDVPRLAGLFAGPGDLAEPTGTVAPPAKRALPLLGRAEPALAEVPRGAERRSGDALRQIFPALFEAPPGDPRRGG
jgi:hypothetical protein